MKHQMGSLVKLEIGPQSEEYEFLVDAGANRSSVLKLPRGCNVSDRKCKVEGAESNPFEVLIIEQVQVK